MKYLRKLKGRPRAAFDWKRAEYEDFIVPRFEELCELFDRRWELDELLHETETGTEECYRLFDEIYAVCNTAWRKYGVVI